MTKSKRLLTLCTAIIILLAAVISVFTIKPDWRYIVCDMLKSPFRSHAEMNVVFPSKLYPLNEGSLPAIAGNGKCTVSDSLMLVNSDHKIPDSFTAEVTQYKDSGVYMNPQMHDAYEDLSKAVYEATGQKLYVMSAYRTAEEQKSVIEEEGEKAVPANESEHVCGLALDVYVAGYAGAGFLKSEAGQFCK